MSLIEKAKELLNSGYGDNLIIEGAENAYDIVKAMGDDELKSRYMGVDPKFVPKEVQEELYLRFVSPHAHYNCGHCFGRGHTAWNPALHLLEPCLCLQKVIRKEVGEENRGYLYDPSGNKIKFMN